MGPLETIRRLYPAIAKREERSLYDRLLKDATTRDDALEKKLRALAMRGVDPSSDRWVDVETQQYPLKIARGNLLTSIYAAPSDDVTARLMLATDPEERRHAASLLHRGIGYYNGDRGLPANGVYIEGLSSEIPGGGTQMLKELEAQFPGAPMYLESVNNPSTLEFYVKKGFLPQPDRSSDAIPRNLFVKPADVKIRKNGGSVQKFGGGGAVNKMLQAFYHGSNAPVKRGALENLDVTPQRRVAEYFAKKRTQQRGGEPTVEMILADPFAGEKHGLALPFDRINQSTPNFTQARRLREQDRPVQINTPSGVEEFSCGGLAALRSKV